MSYDASMTIDTGCGHVEVVDIGNMAISLSPMWTEALGFHISKLNEKSGAECQEHLRKALSDMRSDESRAKYVAMSPSNGWGSVDSAMGFLERIMDACEQHPKATLRLDW